MPKTVPPSKFQEWKASIELSLYYRTVTVIEKLPISDITNSAILDDPAI